MGFVEAKLDSRSHEKSGLEHALDDEALKVRETIYRPDMMAGKRVVVSGGGTGIGKATALLFARLGAEVAICGRREEKLDEAGALIEEVTGRPVMKRQLSIRDADEVERFIGDVHDKLGGIDTLINNAGGQYSQNAMDISRKGWLSVIDTNLNGTWWMMQEAAKRWMETGTQGNITNVVCHVERGCPQVVHTCASRAGVIYASKSVAVEWSQYGIRVNCLAPGAIQTEGFRMYPPEHLDNFRQNNPMKTLSDAWEMAETMVYMSSPAAAFMTGAVITVDGGQALWGTTWPAGRPDWFDRPG